MGHENSKLGGHTDMDNAVEDTHMDGADEKDDSYVATGDKFVYPPPPKPTIPQTNYTYQCPRCKRWFATAFNRRQHFFCITEQEKKRLIDRARANQERQWKKAKGTWFG